MINKKDDIQKYLVDIEKKFKWFYDASTRIVDNNNSMHIIIKTKHSFQIPDREDVDNVDWYIRDIFDKANQIFININSDKLIEYWFVFNNLN